MYDYLEWYKLGTSFYVNNVPATYVVPIFVGLLTLGQIFIDYLPVLDVCCVERAFHIGVSFTTMRPMDSASMSLLGDLTE